MLRKKQNQTQPQVSTTRAFTPRWEYAPLALAAIAALLLSLEYWLQQSGHGGLCPTAGCAVAGASVKYGEIMFIGMGVIFFWVLAAVLFLGRLTDRAWIWKLAAIVLTAGLAFDGGILGFQRFGIQETCILCYAVGAVLLLILLTHGWTRRSLATVVMGLAVWSAGFASQAMFVFPERTPELPQIVLITHATDQPDSAELYYFFSLHCPFCTQVLASLAKHQPQSGTWNLVPLDSKPEDQRKLSALLEHPQISDNPFQAVLCNVGKPNEKGKVESGIKYIRQSFLAGRFFRDYYDLKAQSWQWRDDVANRRIHGTTQKSSLKPLSERRQRFFLAVEVRSSSQSLIRFDSNYYSVPIKYALSDLTLRANSREVHFFDRDKLVAAHYRSFGKYQTIDKPEHFEGLLKLKKKARAIAIRKEFLELGDAAQAYLEGLTAAELNPGHHLKKIGKLVRLYGRRQVVAAIEFALEHKAFGCEYLKNIILQERSRRGMKEIINPLIIHKRPELNNLTVEDRDLRIYDDLFE